MKPYIILLLFIPNLFFSQNNQSLEQDLERFSEMAYFVKKGSDFAKNNRHYSAIESFTEALKIDSNDDMVYFMRANSFLSLGDYKNAIDDYTQAINIKPNYSDALFNRGLAYEKISSHINALKDFNKLAEMNLMTNDPSLYYHIGINYGMTGDNASACKNIFKAQKLGYNVSSEILKICYQ
jgi:tetratricopeptide (TPR) repeat protein